MKNGEQPAFANPGSEQGSGSMGLTKREYFAAMAMQGILANGNGQEPKSGPFDIWNYWAIANKSIEAADELLKALES